MTKRKKTKQQDLGTSVSDVYLNVMDDVIRNVQEDFHADGVGNNALHELRSLWELRMMQLGAIQEVPPREIPEKKPIVEPGAALPMRDLNFPYSAKVEPSEASSSHMDYWRVNPSTGAREPPVFQYFPAGPSQESDWKSSGPQLGIGTPSPHMLLPVPWMNQTRHGVEIKKEETNVVKEEVQDGPAQLPITARHVPPIPKDFLTISKGKRKLDEISLGDNISQRDDATDEELPPSTADSSHTEETGEFEFWAGKSQ